MKLLLLLIVSVCRSDIHFKETFSSEQDFLRRWIPSKHKDGEQGVFKLSAGKFFNDEKEDIGLQTSQDAKFYGISAKIDKPFSTAGKPLVLQFTVKHEQGIDCGGGYIKLLGTGIDQEKFHGEIPYKIMFGPDICGSTKKVHVIFTYKGKNLLIKKDINCKDDELTHIYTLLVHPDKKYEVLIDNEKAESGQLEDDWDFLEPKKIDDPNAKKPDDWDDKEKIPDPKDTKPADWDKPKTIADPKAKKPEDWDDEMDGEWEPPKIDNPDYKGEWKAKEIPNPNYRGVWQHPKIDNPKYVADDSLHVFENVGLIAFDLWQVKSGTIFDNILVTDEPETAKKEAEHIKSTTMKGEKIKKDKKDAEDRKREEEEDKKRQEEEKKKAEAEKKAEEEKKAKSEKDAPDAAAKEAPSKQMEEKVKTDESSTKQKEEL